MFCLFCLPVFVWAQDEPQEKIIKTTDLGVGNVFQLDQIAVEFLKVISDSRCPKQVTCIWPGEAKVLLGISLGGKYFEKEVIVSGRGAALNLAEGLQMSVSHLRPYPETGAGIAPEEYCLRFTAALLEGDQ